MNRLRRMAGPLLAVALILLLGTELLAPDRFTPPPSSAAVVEAPAGAAPADLKISQWAQTTLARPVFNSDRRPVQQPSSSGSASLSRLSAIIISGSTGSAIFAGDGPLPSVVRQGGQIDGYEVETILPDAVKLAGPGGRLTLRPQFGNAPAAGTQPDTAAKAPANSSANVPTVISKNAPPPPPPPPIPTASSRFDDDPI